MDNRLKELIEKKIKETLENTDELNDIKNNLSGISSEKISFTHGLVLGRLYNSFYYQSRRILKRNPSSEEFSEFLELLKTHDKEIQAKLEKL